MAEAIAPLYLRLREGLGEVIPARQRFQGFFDAWLRAELADGRAHSVSNFVHGVWLAGQACQALDPVPKPQDTSEAVCLALAALADGVDAYACVVAAIAAGIFDPSADAKSVTTDRQALSKRMLDALERNQSRAVRQAVSSREALIDDDDFWTDMGHLLPSITLARRRLCRIEASPPDKASQFGTGFLIGPSLVLTNLHVVAGIEEHLPVEKLRKLRLELRFDFSETTGRKKDKASTYFAAEHWCVAKGGLGDDTHEGPKEDYWWNAEAKRMAWDELVQDTLDYAIIRVEGTPGLQRGWYSLTDVPEEPAVGAWALHHPNKLDQTVTRGVVQAKLNKVMNSRMFHGASTAKGSSGGLLLDQDGAPMALHYLGLKAENEDPAQENHRINVGIPFKVLADALEAQGILDSLEQVTGMRPHRGCLDGRQPLFGRLALLDDLHHFWEGSARILRVSVTKDEIKAKRPGKSYTTEVIKGLFRAPEHHHITFSAAELKVDALRIARDTLRTFADDLATRLETDDSFQTPDTSSPAHVRRLVQFFGRAIRDRLPNRHVWVIIDDLDRFDVSDASGREFLATLYDTVADMPWLRIVLIGLPDVVEISGMAKEDSMSSHIDGSELDALGACLTNWLKERGGRDFALTDESYRLIQQMLVSYAGKEAPLERLNEFVTEHLTDVVTALFGSATLPAGAEQ